MAFRFRRSFKIAPGIRWNISKTGSSWTIGPKGFTHNFRGGRVTRTVGLPGTGLSHRSVVSSAPTVAAGNPAPQPIDSGIWPGRFGLPVSNGHRTLTGVASMIFLLGSTAFVPLILVSIVCGATWMLMPSPTRLVVDERSRRLDEWRALVRALPKPASVPELRQLLADFERLELMSQEDPGTIAALHAQVEFQTFVQTCERDGQLHQVRGVEDEVGSDACFFMAGALYDKRGPNDDHGVLYLTNQRIVFVGGASLHSIPWAKAFSVTREGHRLSVQRTDRKTPTIYQFANLTDSLKSEYVIRQIRASL